MFGDDLKKSLEPIKTSDELLEKTRLAIEKARLEQAKASLEPAHTESKKRSSSFGFSWKMVVPIACALLVVGGAVMVTSYVNKAKDASKNGEIKSHNKSIDVAEQIDAALDGDRYYYADTTAANSAEAAYEDDSEGMEWMDSPVEEETTSAAESTVSGHGNQQKSEGPRSIRPSKDSDFSESVQLDGSLLCISEDHRSLILADPKTGEPLPSEEGKSVPDFSFLSADQRIQGLNYQEEYGLLFVSVGSDSNELGQTKTQHLYACAYKDGILQSEKPESVD